MVVTRILRVAGLALLAHVLLAPAAFADRDEDLSGRRVVQRASRPVAHPSGELELEVHDVRVKITAGFATTTVVQTLRNSGTRAIEARWSFPLPEKAALAELSTECAGVRSVGEVVERQRAQRLYEGERRAGRQAGLAERRDTEIYTVRLANVPAGGRVTARVVYFQALEMNAGVGRYVYPMADGGTDPAARAFWSMDKKVHGRMSFDVEIEAGFPVDRLHSPSHPRTVLAGSDEAGWRATMTSPGARLHQDFVLLYRLRPDVPANIELLTHRTAGTAHGTFMAVVTPGSDLAPITKGTDWVFVLDTSGSMEGAKMQLLREGMARALAGLAPQDRFRIVTFSERAQERTRGFLQATPTGIRQGRQIADGLHAKGSTNLFAGLSLGYHGLDDDRSTAMVVVGDGVANTGPHEYADFLRLSAAHDIRIFTFLLGGGGNELLMNDLAAMSGGTDTSLSTHDDLGASLLLARDRMTHEAIHGITFEMEGAYDIHPKRIPSHYLGQQIVVVGRYRDAGAKTLSIRAQRSGEPLTWSAPVELPEVDLRRPELERLHALGAIRDLEREALLDHGDLDAARDAIVDVATTYGLVTKHTAMIVVEEGRKAALGIGDANRHRRGAEEAAAAARAASPRRSQQVVGNAPLGGPRREHAPTRWSNQGSGGGRGSGALGPWALLLAAGFVAGARRRRREDV